MSTAELAPIDPVEAEELYQRCLAATTANILPKAPLKPLRRPTEYQPRKTWNERRQRYETDEKRPEMYEALQYDGTEAMQRMLGSWGLVEIEEGGKVKLAKRELREGDWVVRRVRDYAVSVLSADLFEARYLLTDPERTIDCVRLRPRKRAA